MSQILTDIEALVTPILSAEQVELVDLTYQKTHSGWTLSLYLDKPGGITLDDCERWSRELGNVVETANILNHGYVLEVSSPGLDRALRKSSDFEKFAGQRVHAKLFAPINGQKNFHGTLLGADEENIRIHLEDQKRDVELPRSQVAKCRLDPVIDF